MGVSEPLTIESLKKIFSLKSEKSENTLGRVLKLERVMEKLNLKNSINNQLPRRVTSDLTLVDDETSLDDRI